MECKVNLSVSSITPIEFNKTKFELSDKKTEAFIYCTINITNIDITLYLVKKATS